MNDVASRPVVASSPMVLTCTATTAAAAAAADDVEAAATSASPSAFADTTPAASSWRIDGMQDWATAARGTLVSGAAGREKSRLAFVRGGSDGVAAERLEMDAQRVSMEAVTLPQIMKQTKVVSLYKMAVGRLVELLTQCERGEPVGVCYADEHYLTGRKNQPLTGVNNLLRMLGAEAQDATCPYDVVLYVLEDDAQAKVAAVRRSLERELYYLRFSLEPNALWEGNTVAPILLCHLADYQWKGVVPDSVDDLELRLAAAVEAEAEKAAAAADEDDEEEEEEEEPAFPILKAAQRTWELALFILAYATLTKDPVVCAQQAASDLAGATQVFCEAAAWERRRRGGSDDEEEEEDDDDDDYVCVPDDAMEEVSARRKFEVVGEPCGEGYWRLPEGAAFSQSAPRDPAALMRREEDDRPVLLNVDSSCWLNTVLVVFYHLHPFRRFVMLEADPKGAPLVQHLRRLYSFMTPGVSARKYLYNSWVRYSLYTAMDPDAVATLSDSCELLTLFPDLLPTKTVNGGDEQSTAMKRLFHTKVQTFPLDEEAEAEEAENGEEAGDKTHTEYPLFVAVSSEKTAAFRQQFEDDGGAGAAAATCVYDTLPLLLMESMQAADRSVNGITAAPQALVVNVRRRLWDAAKGRPVYSDAAVDVPLALDLAPLVADPERIALRRQLARREAELEELCAFSPAAQYGIAADAPMPASLARAFGGEGCAALAEQVAELRRQAARVGLAHSALKEEKTAAVVRLHEQLGIKSAAGDSEEEEEEDAVANPYAYTLGAVILYSEYWRGHYWAYVRVAGEDDAWIRCDDRPKPGHDLPNYYKHTTEQMLEEARTAAACMVFTRPGVLGSGVAGDVLDRTAATAAADSKALWDLVGLAGLEPYNDDDEYESEEGGRGVSSLYYDYSEGAEHYSGGSFDVHEEAATGDPAEAAEPSRIIVGSYP